MLKVDTDEGGVQYLSVPWMPNKKMPYKALSLQQRLLDEVFGGALGELSKDVLLHPIDTFKIREGASVLWDHGYHHGIPGVYNATLTETAVEIAHGSGSYHFTSTTD